MTSPRDENAFAALVREHHRALIAIASPIVGASEAEEVVQNAWVKAYKARDSFRGDAAARSWLTRIVINEARMQLRARKRESFFSEVDADTSPDALQERFRSDGRWRHPPVAWGTDDPADLLAGHVLEDCLDTLLGHMTGPQRSVFELRERGGLPFEEICERLDVSPGNARVLLHRARSALFQLVDRYEETGEC